MQVLAKRPNGIWTARFPFEFKVIIAKDSVLMKLNTETIFTKRPVTIIIDLLLYVCSW